MGAIPVNQPSDRPFQLMQIHRAYALKWTDRQATELVYDEAMPSPLSYWPSRRRLFRRQSRVWLAVPVAAALAALLTVLVKALHGFWR